MPDPAVRYWPSMTTVDAQSLAESDPVVVLPLASLEQHGPHLPLSTDLDIGLGLVERAVALLPPEFPILILPPQAVGASLEHVRFPGTLSLPADLLADVIYQAGLGVARCGIRRLLLSSSHGGNGAVMDTVGLRLRHEAGLLVVKAHYADFPAPRDHGLPDSEWRHGLHGGAVETAMMLHLRPDLVRMGDARATVSLGSDLEGAMRRLGPEGAASFSWLAGDLHPSGVTGNARLATAALGRALVDHYAALMADVIHDTRAFPLDQLT